MKPVNLLVLVCAFAAISLPAGASSLSPCDSVAGNLVSNCGFETGDFTGWNGGGNNQYYSTPPGSFSAFAGANSGGYYAVFGPVGSDGTLSQTLSTTAGTDYTFAFYLAAEGDDPSDFSAYWDGGEALVSLTDPNTGAAYSLFSFTVTGTGSDTIQFNFRDDPAYLALDDISVSPEASDVPEPGTWGLLALGLGVALLGRRWLFA